MMRIFLALVRRDLALATRVGGAGGLSLVFFLMVVTLIPFGLGPDLNLLSRIGPAILWIAGVLATLIGLDRLFQADEEDGSLDIMRSQDIYLYRTQTRVKIEKPSSSGGGSSTFSSSSGRSHGGGGGKF